MGEKISLLKREEDLTYIITGREEWENNSFKLEKVGAWI